MTRILIVDDSPIDRTLALGMFRNNPAYQVLSASDGSEALTRLAEGGIDAVITDMQMPELDGLELLEEVALKYPQIPVILMTARGSEELASEALASGAASYVPKRRIATDLVATVDRVCRLAGRHSTGDDLTDCLTRTESEYLFPSRLEVLMNAAGTLPAGIERFWHCKPTIRMQLSVAIEEALTNAYFYGSLDLDHQMRRNDIQNFYSLAEDRSAVAPFCDRRIRVAASYGEDKVEFTIEDQGAGFEVARILEQDAADDLTEGDAGRGIRLMRTFMDDVSFNNCGNRVTLIKRRTDHE